MSGTKLTSLGRNATVGDQVVITTGGTALAAATVDGAYLWTNESNKRYVVVYAVARWTAAGGTSGRVTIERCPSGTAVGSGTDIHLTSGWDVDTADTASNPLNTNLVLTVDDTEGSSGKNIVEPNESLYFETSGTLTNLAGFVCTVVLREIPPLKGS